MKGAMGLKCTCGKKKNFYGKGRRIMRIRQ